MIPSNRPEVKPSWAMERWLLKRLLQTVGSPAITLELWDGVCISAGQIHHDQRIRILDRRTLWKMLLRPDFEIAEAYVSGRLQTNCDLVDITSRHFIAWRCRSSYPFMDRLCSWAQSGTRTLKTSLQNVEHHYDLGNDFYRLWLDEKLLYTCAYFETEDVSLEQAQLAKMDHVCRKLWLKPGDRVIEAGSGWGALAIYMAQHYGATVTAYNISREQIRYAREQSAAAGVGDRVTFIEDDWRHIQGECDAFVSIGMLEHVGPENYEKLGAIINRSLTPEGRGLIHTIGLDRPRKLDSWTQRRIFPGAQPPSLQQAMQIFEPNGQVVLDVENLRLHYAETLRHWLSRFEDHSEEVARMFDDHFVRMWRLYLSASVSAFETGWLHLFQILFAPAIKNGLPLTRRYIYEPRESGPAFWQLAGGSASKASLGDS